MKTRRIFAVSLFMLGLLVVGIFVPPAAAQAANGQDIAVQRTPGPWKQTLVPVRETLSALPTPDGAALEDLLVREKLVLSNQQSRLTLSHTVAGATQTYIDNQKSAGKDTSLLESALDNFNQAISQAEADNATAAGILANPAGFNASGQVEDRNAALKTLRSAGQSLRKAHLTLTQATLDLREAVQTYRGK